VGGVTPIKDLLRLSDLVRGVAGAGKEGKGTETVLDVRVIVEGVHVEKLGEGGKTNKV